VHLSGKAGQRQGVRDVWAAVSEQVCDLAMAVCMAFDQSGQGLRFLERCQVLALEVLDQRDFQGIAALAHDGRQTIEPRETGCPEAPLSGQELIALPVTPDNDGLEQAALENRGGELDQLPLGKVLPGLLWIGFDRVERYHREHDALPAERRRTDRQDRLCPFPLSRLRPHAPPPRRRLPGRSRASRQRVPLPHRPGGSTPVGAVCCDQILPDSVKAITSAYSASASMSARPTMSGVKS